MKKILFILLYILLSESVSAQYNFVPNFDFTLGVNTPGCKYSFCSGDPQKIEDDISFWYAALHNPNCFEWCIQKQTKMGITTCPTPDWVDRAICISGMKLVAAPYTNSDRFIRVGVGTIKSYYEGIRVQLFGTLQSGKVYILKLKLAPKADSATSDIQLDFHMTRWSERWNSNRKGNTKMRDIANFNLSNSPYEWKEYHCIFMVPQSKHGLMDNLVLIRRGINSSTETNMFIDQVELYEYCPPQLPFQKRTFDMVDEFPYEADVITAGEDFLNWWPQGPVKVIDTMAQVKFKAASKVHLLPGFQVERGGRFRGWISPCLLPCPFPLADGGPDTTVCGPGCISLGGDPTYGMTYEWTSNPETAIQRLSSTTVSNPVFCPPEGAGRLRFFVKATNQCGQHWKDEVIVDYDNNPNPFPDFNISNLDLSDSLSFDMSVSTHTETIKVEILDCSTPAHVLRTYEYDRDDDFTCCNFHFEVDRYYNPCPCYKIKVSTKNFCFDIWKDTIFDWTRSQTFHFDDHSVVICKNKADYDWDSWLWIATRGAIWYDFEVRDRWNIKVGGYSGLCLSDTLALWHPSVSDGTYYVILDLYDCNNTKHTYTWYIGIFTTCSPKREWDNDPNAINTLYSSGKFSVFPNPVSSYIDVYGQILNDPTVEIELYDIFGNRELLITDKVDLGTFYKRIDLHTFANGFYILKIRNAESSEMYRIAITK